jgi:hypothetical protein
MSVAGIGGLKSGAKRNVKADLVVTLHRDKAYLENETTNLTKPRHDFSIVSGTLVSPELLKLVQECLGYSADL